MHHKTLSLLVAVLGGLPFAAQARADGALLSVDVGRSTLTYAVVHKLHKVEGISKKVEGKARIAPGGQAQVMIRVPVESFDSGNSNRDAHMKEAVEAARYPVVELKAITSNLNPPTSFPTTVSQTWKGQVTFHGVSQPIDVAVQLTFEAADRIRADAQLTLSLDAFKVERPSLMFVKVDDQMKIEAKLAFGK